MLGTNADLRYMYLDFNRRYFGNRLPKDMPVYFDDIDCLGHTAVAKQTFRPEYIRISKRLRFSNRMSAMTLFHEMCHVETPKYRGHGPWFRKRMKQLAKAGAFDPFW
jgi:hypothetical protein